MMRTDKHNNPTAFTTDLAKQAGLVLGLDYIQGDPFTVGANTYHTAKLLLDPIKTTIEVIDAVGYVTKAGIPRWTYINLVPKFTWSELTPERKRDVIGYHYLHEGGTAMRGLFPNYGLA
jgi:hypothetical protein